MERKRLIIILLVVVLLLGTLGGLVAWLIIRLNNRFSNSYETIPLHGEGVGEAGGTAAFVRFRSGAHMLRWFVPTEAEAEGAQGGRPLVLWLDGVAGRPPSLLANFGTVGPYDFNFNRRNDSWVSDYNLLFVDAPVGSGFSYVQDEDQAAGSVRDNSCCLNLKLVDLRPVMRWLKQPTNSCAMLILAAEDLVRTLHSFYAEQGGRFSETPLYILGQGYGGQMAAHFALLLQEYIDSGVIDCNLQGVILGNPIVSPALVTSQLGFYLEELGYVDDRGRAAIETLARDTQQLVEAGEYLTAYELWAELEDAVAGSAGAVAVNLHRIVDKLTRESTRAASTEGACEQCSRYLRSALPPGFDVSAFMDGVVAPALGVASGIAYDAQKTVADLGLLAEFMRPAHEEIEKILANTDLSVWIYNGNLDAISNTPGQLLWIEALQWNDSDEWLASPRLPLAVAGQLEGYVRSAGQLHLYWMNVAGHAVANDSPAAMREVLRRIAGY